MRFDQAINRQNTHSVKFDARDKVFGRGDVLPLWVADMDFAAPEAVTRALSERAAHPVYGYTLFPDSLYEAMIEWYRERHQWEIDRQSILMAPGVVPTLHAASLAFAAEGEGIIIQPPVYPPFFSAIKDTGRRVIENPLSYSGSSANGGRYEIDLEHLERCASETDARVLFLCSPHNPVGRVWSEAELRAVLDIARRHDLIVVADEIHGDLVFPDSARHFALATLAGPEDKLITTVAPSKTFNMPGLGLSAVVVDNPTLRRQLKAVFQRQHSVQCNPFSVAGFEAGYRHGGPWRDELMAYLQANRDFVVEQIAHTCPGIRVDRPEGCYLLWLDCRALGLDDDALKAFFVEKAGVGLNPGLTFGQQGSGYMRLNLGSPRVVLEQAINQISKALHGAR